jgi:hypothetical protein
LAAFKHFTHLLKRAPAGVPQAPLRPAGGERNPIPGIFAGLGSEQKRQAYSYSKTDQQTHYSMSFRHGVPFRAGRSVRFGAGILCGYGRLGSALCRFDVPLAFRVGVVLEQELSQIDSDEVCVHMQ